MFAVTVLAALGLLTTAGTGLAVANQTAPAPQAGASCGWNWWTGPSSEWGMHAVHVNNSCPGSPGRTVGISVVGLDPCERLDRNGWATFDLAANGTTAEQLYFEC